MPKIREDDVLRYGRLFTVVHLMWSPEASSPPTVRPSVQPCPSSGESRADGLLPTVPLEDTRSSSSSSG